MIQSLGACVSLLGIALIYGRTGQLGLAQVGVALRGHRPDNLVSVAFVLVLTAMLVKAAIVPVHFWLADAHAVAPAPVCVLFFGVMVEVGLYGTGRVFRVTFAPTLPHAVVGRTLAVLGVLTAVIGAVVCLLQHHLKRMLAYSTIAHMGLFLLAFGTLSGDGAGGIAVFVLGHAGAKGALFLVVRVLLDRFGTVDERRLAGRGRGHPGPGDDVIRCGTGVVGGVAVRDGARQVADRGGDRHAGRACAVRGGVGGHRGSGAARRAAVLHGPGREGGRAAGIGAGRDDEVPEQPDTRRLGRAPVSMYAAICVLLPG